jgi:hypothetical protein
MEDVAMKIIDTRPGGLFSPSVAVDDYAAWFAARYQSCQVNGHGRAMFFGMGQVVNAITYAVANHGEQVFIIGPYAKDMKKIMAEKWGLARICLGRVC